MQRRVREKRYRIWGALFLGGFFLGMLLMNVSGDKLLGDSGIFNPGMMRQLALEEIDGGQFLIYVLRQRYGILLGMFLLSLTSFGLLFLSGAVLWQGLLAGMILASAVIRFGLKGLLLILGIFFPHQLLLFPAWFLFLDFCYAGFMSRGSALIEGRGGRMERKRRVRQLLWLMWICVMVLISCILESYVNPILIGDLAKIFY